MRLRSPPGRKRQGGRNGLVGGRERDLEKKRMDVWKQATTKRGEQDMRCENDGNGVLERGRKKGGWQIYRADA